MIEPVFNEFSAQPLCADGEAADSRFKTLVNLIRYLGGYGMKRVRYENSIGDIPFTVTGTLGDYCSKIRQNRSAQNAARLNEVYFLYGKIKPPFFNESEKSFPNNLKKTVLLDSDNGSELIENPLSLMSAHFLGSFSIGFDNQVKSPLKLRLSFSKMINGKKENEYSKDVELICVTNKEACLKDKQFINLIASQEDLPIPIPNSKKSEFTLPDHHGAKECAEHGKELLNTPYVTDILSTRAFKAGDSEYISKINDDGSIEVRLYWTNAGYGLLISTSGTDIIQTTWIANQLNKKFGKK